MFKEFLYPLNSKQVSRETLEELTGIANSLNDRRSKQVSGEEYLDSEESLYRGCLFGVVVATIYTHAGGIFQDPNSTRTQLWVDTSKRGCVATANEYATKDYVTQKFEEDLSKRGFSISSAGAVLLAFSKLRLPYTKTPMAGYGLVIDIPVSVSKLTPNCKEYILEELRLDSFSYAHSILYPSI